MAPQICEGCRHYVRSHLDAKGICMVAKCDCASVTNAIRPYQSLEDKFRSFKSVPRAKRYGEGNLWKD